MNHNKTLAEKLDDLLEKRAVNRPEDRDLSEDERRMLDKWKNEINSQDEDLLEIHDKLGQVKLNVKEIGNELGQQGRKINQINNAAGKTELNIKKTNDKVAELIKKIKADSICMYIILIGVLLGLIAVLYNIIKNKL
jgi:hypothetical protein